MVVALAGLVFAGVVSGKNGRIPNGPSGKSHISHLYLYEKDPATWEIVEGGAWGKMKYNYEGSPSVLSSTDTPWNPTEYCSSMI